MWEKAQLIFSNRELAFLIWLLLLSVIAATSKKVRKSVRGFIQALFQWKVFSSFLILTLISVLLVVTLKVVGIWHDQAIKDSLLWFIGFAAVTFIYLLKLKSKKNFVRLVKEAIGVTVFIEFLANLKSFSLLWEMILWPTLLICSVLVVINDKKPSSISRFSIGYLVLVSLVMLIYSSTAIFSDWSQIASTTTLYTFIFPILLTLGVIPYFYLQSYRFQLEEIAFRLTWIYPQWKNKNLQRELWLATCLNLNALNQIGGTLDYEIMEFAQTPEKYFELAKEGFTEPK